MEERIFYPSIGFRLFIPFLGLAGVVVGYQMLSDEAGHYGLLSNAVYREGVGMFLIIGASIGTALGLINLLPQACFLKFDPEKLMAVIFFYPQELKWIDVRLFRSFQFRQSSRYQVVADVYDNASLPLKKREALRDRYGCDFFLPCNYGMSAQKLTDLLNEWRNRYGRQVVANNSLRN
jgi:hypothetical protein